MYIMSNEKNKEEDPELLNSQESTTTYPSEALIEKDNELTAKKPAEERKVVVVKPSEVEYKENNQIENSSAREQNKEKGEGEQSAAAAKAKKAGQSFIEMIKSLGKKAVTKTEERTKELKDKSRARYITFLIYCSVTLIPATPFFIS